MLTQAAAPASAPGAAPVVWACVVCYHADPDAIRALAATLAPQVARLLLLDNSPGSPPQLAALQAPGIVYVPMPGNAGTAGAMNHAWRLALAAGATHVVCFDQDSRPPAGFVAGLLRCWNTDAGTGHAPPLAAVGPAWRDARTGRPLRLLAPVRLWRRHVQAPEHGLVEVDHLITSGCLVSAQAFRAVGPFDEALFLDYVDIEWSVRARARGWRLAVCGEVGMEHAIGDAVRPLAGRQLAIHHPRRNYLLLRNHMLLWRQGEIPRLWLLSDLFMVTAKAAALLVLAPPRGARLRAMARGVRDGLAGRGGPPPA